MLNIKFILTSAACLLASSPAFSAVTRTALIDLTQTTSLTVSVLPLDIAARGVGTLTVTTTHSGSLTGSLVLGGVTRNFTGVLDSEDELHITLPPKGPGGESVDLSLDLTDDGTVEVTTAALGNTTASFWRLVKFNSANPNPVSGTYNSYGNTFSEDLAFYGTHVKVKNNGSVTGIGYAPDGHAVTFGSALHQGIEETVPEEFLILAYDSLFGRRGAYQELIRLVDDVTTNEEDEEVQEVQVFGEGIYIRPPATDVDATYLPDGVASAINCYNLAYVKPVGPGRPMGYLDESEGLGQFVVGLNADEYVELSADFELKPNGRFIIAPNDIHLKMALDRVTGLVTGSFVYEGIRHPLRGILSASPGTISVEGTAKGGAKPSVFTLNGY